MNTALFSNSRTNGTFEESGLDTGEVVVNVLPGENRLTLAVAGRVTVDSSPDLRSMILKLLRRRAASVLEIDLSAVSYLDMSGIATLLEALKAAAKRSVKLRLTGMSGQSRTLAEIAQLDAIFRAWGSEVEFL